MAMRSNNPLGKDRQMLITFDRMRPERTCTINPDAVSFIEEYSYYDSIPTSQITLMTREQILVRGSLEDVTNKLNGIANKKVVPRSRNPIKLRAAAASKKKKPAARKAKSPSSSKRR